VAEVVGAVEPVPAPVVAVPLDGRVEPEDAEAGDVAVPVTVPEAGVVNEIDWGVALGPVALRERAPHSALCNARAPWTSVGQLVTRQAPASAWNCEEVHTHVTLVKVPQSSKAAAFVRHS